MFINNIQQVLTFLSVIYYVEILVLFDALPPMNYFMLIDL